MDVFLNGSDYIFVTQIRCCNYGERRFQLGRYRFLVICGCGFYIPERHKHQSHSHNGSEKSVPDSDRNADTDCGQSQRASAKDTEHIRSVGEPQYLLRFRYLAPENIRFLALGRLVDLRFYAVRFGEEPIKNPLGELHRRDPEHQKKSDDHADTSRR